MATAGTITLKNERELRRLFDQTPAAVFDRAVAPAARRTMTPVSRTAKKRITALRLHDRSGLLRKSIGVQAKRYKKRGTMWVGIGPRTGFRAVVTTRQKRVVLRNPVNYAHLIEQGFRHRSGRVVPARSFLRAAMLDHLATIERQFATELSIQIPKVTERLAKRAAATSG